MDQLIRIGHTVLEVRERTGMTLDTAIELSRLLLSLYEASRTPNSVIHLVANGIVFKSRYIYLLLLLFFIYFFLRSSYALEGLVNLLEFWVTWIDWDVLDSRFCDAFSCQWYSF